MRIGQHPAIFPEHKIAGAVFAHEPLGAFGNGGSALGAGPDFFAQRRKQALCLLNALCTPRQLRYELPNVAHELLGLFSPLLDVLETLFPLRRQKRRAERLGQYRSQCLSLGRGQQHLSSPVSDALNQPGFNQLFQNRSSGSRRANAFVLRTLGHVFLARRFHRVQKGALGVMHRRRRLPFFDAGLGERAFISFAHAFGQGG